MNKRNLAVEKKILDEVMRSTWKKGTGNVSTKEIAKKVGISEPSVFAHFKTKQILLNSAFAQAWEFMNDDPTYQKASFIPDENTYALYRDLIDSHIHKHKKEIVFISHYLASTYYDHDFVQKVEKPYRDGLKAIFNQMYGRLNEADFDVFVVGFIELCVRSLTHLVLGDFEDNEHNRELLFNQVIYGVHGTINPAPSK
jgi:AcrR family transcriptional regulator